MHRFFFISELVEIIVEALAEWSFPPPTNMHHKLNGLWTPDVESFGLTSRLFREPCLNATWRKQYSLVPLLRSVGVVGEISPWDYTGTDTRIFVRDIPSWFNSTLKCDIHSFALDSEESLKSRRYSYIAEILFQDTSPGPAEGPQSISRLRCAPILTAILCYLPQLACVGLSGGSLQRD